MKKQKTVLLVEDNTDNRIIYAAMLRHVGYDVLEAPDGEVGVELAQEHSPDLILMDLSMPRMDGWKAISALRRDPQTKNIVVCALSAHVLHKGDWERARTAGFDCYLTKPITPQDVLEEVKARIGGPVEELG